MAKADQVRSGTAAGTLGGMGMLELTGFVLDRGLGYQPSF